MSIPRLSRINTALLVAIVLINGYIVVLPLLPSLLFRLQQHDGARATELARAVDSRTHATPATDPSHINQLVIPSMLLDETVHPGKTSRTLRQGLWLRPTGSTPDNGGNTVIAGHRFTYTNPHGSFYHLDEVHVGDPIALFWQGKRYLYKVTEVKTVKATQTEIEAPTDRPRLTLYTCTPLWLPKDRLVVVAERTDTQ